MSTMQEDLHFSPNPSSDFITQGILLAKKIIEDNFDEKISRQFLCKKTGLNRTTLNEEFQKMFGVSAKEYQVRLKIERAKRLLQETDDRIYHIAYQLGYEHRDNFSLEFKRRVGVSPSAWRRGVTME
jgi:two-component system response regulator YesN